MDKIVRIKTFGILLFSERRLYTYIIPTINNITGKVLSIELFITLINGKYLLIWGTSNVFAPMYEEWYFVNNILIDESIEKSPMEHANDINASFM